MQMDIVELRRFYASPLGQAVERSLTLSLASMWTKLSSERLLGLGHTAPWLDRFGVDAERAFSFQPARQGAMRWPHGKPCASALVFDEDLPLPDSSIDRVLMVHALEHCEDAEETLREIWRVMTSGGRLVIVVPNRRGLWARMDHTPFGAGRPYSTGQLTRLLRATGFTPTASGDALGFPPFRRQWLLKSAGGIERITRRIAPMLAGAIVVEATKRIHQGITVRERQSRRVFAPVLAPQRATRDIGNASNANALIANRDDAP